MTTTRATFSQVQALLAQLEQHALTAQDAEVGPESLEAFLSWAAEQLGPSLTLASSFGPEDMVLIDAIAKRDLPIRVITLDTGRLPEQTYTLIDATQARYPNLNLEVFFPEAQDIEALSREQGINGFYKSVEARRQCCHVRKVLPLKRALSGANAWITGMRAEQSATRTHIARVELDLANGSIIKLNPLLSWTRAQLWDHIKAHDIPYNALHDQGYPSLGCAPCTRAVAPGEDERAGRWWWEQPTQKECGLHVHHATPNS